MKKVKPRGSGGKIKLTRASRKTQTSFYRDPDPAPDWALSDRDWLEIEDAYGHNLPEGLRSEIAGIISDYLHSAQAEKSKADAEDSIAFLSRLEEKASSLTEMLVGDLNNTAAVNARNVLRTEYFFDQDDPDFEQCPYETKTVALAEALRALASAALAFAGDVNAEATREAVRLRPKPSAWDVMIAQLTDVFTSHGLPARAVKGQAGEFVSCIHELQERFAAEFRRYQYGRDGELSIDATEKAIFQAQSAHRKHQERRKKAKLYLRFRRMRPHLKKICARRPDIKSERRAS